MRFAVPIMSLALVSGALTGCAHPSRALAQEEVTVEAEGWTPLDHEHPLQAKQRALAEAQRKAVEKALGVTVSATTKVESAITLEQRITANVGGSIRSYEILSERENDGFLKTLIRARVLLRPAAREVSSIHFFVRCADEKLATALRAALTVRGFSVSRVENDGEYIVSGEASVYSMPSPYAELRSYRARVSVDVLSVKTSESFRLVQEASAIDPADALARDKAVDTAAGLVVESVGLRLRAQSSNENAASSTKHP